MMTGSIPAEQWEAGTSPASCWGVARTEPMASWGSPRGAGAAGGSQCPPWHGCGAPGASRARATPGLCQHRDSHVTVCPLYLCSVSSAPYDYEISGPLGRENYKEMYLFIYR